MNIANIIQSLQSLFSPENTIVFWNDADGEFSELLGELTEQLAQKGIRLLECEKYADLELKVMLDLEKSPEDFFLLYSPKVAPLAENDWLLNIRLYSKAFSADTATMQVGELGLANSHLREHLKERKKFLAAQERIVRLKKFLHPEANENDIDSAMIAVCARAERVNLHEILIRLFIEQYAEDTTSLLNGTTPCWNNIEKFALADSFWSWVAKDFAYSGNAVQEETGALRYAPSLKHLLISLLVTDMALSLGDKLPKSLAHFAIKEPRVRGNASVLRSEWLQNRRYHGDYVNISGNIAQEIGLDAQIRTLDYEDFDNCVSFESIERAVISDIMHCAQNGTQKTDTLRAAIQKRREGYWVESFKNRENVALYAVVYDGLEALLGIRALQEKYATGFAFAHAQQAYTAYTKELYLFDQYYRHFCIAADKIETFSDILKPARLLVDEWISKKYMAELTRAWEQILSGQDGLMETWHIPDVPLQAHFYPQFVKPILNSSGKPRVFIIISDGLRYEVAEELHQRISLNNSKRNAENRAKKSKITMQSQMSVLPSITSIGMAALLPHARLSFKNGTSDVLVDGMPCANIEQRNALLERVEGKAIKADDLCAMGRDEARDFLRGVRVVYVYHNQIDSTGDNKASEEETFAASQDTIESLSSLVACILERLQGNHVLITADHGFLYQDSALTEDVKTSAIEKSHNIIKAKKRYVLGTELQDSATTWHGSTAITASMCADEGQETLEFCVPKGVGRFHFQGGARYTHGGAMPQEIIVPVIQVQELSDKNPQSESVQRVEITRLGSVNRIVNNIQRFEFIQNDKISERIVPRTLNVFISDGENAISDVKTLIFDSTSDKMDERKKSVQLILKNGNYDNKKPYYLLLRDVETSVEYARYSMVIDLSFQNMF